MTTVDPGPDPPLPYRIPPHWPPDYHPLCPHFWRIRRQPESVQPLLLSKVSCGLRLPPQQIQELYQEFCHLQT